MLTCQNCDVGMFGVYGSLTTSPIEPANAG